MLERSHDPSGLAPGLPDAAGVAGERPATALSGRYYHVAALQRQHPSRGRRDVGEEGGLYATGEQADHRSR
jgi:hypothetical protein